jgi:hypothetical protein
VTGAAGCACFTYGARLKAKTIGRRVVMNSLSHCDLLVDGISARSGKAHLALRAIASEAGQTGLSFFLRCQIAQFDCSVCASEEADEARTDRDDPRRIDTGHNPDVDEPGLQHSTADCAAKPKNDPKNKDKRAVLLLSFAVPKGRSQNTPLKRHQA